MAPQNAPRSNKNFKKKTTYPWGCFQVLFTVGELREHLEAVILQHIHPLVVGSQVIYLFPVHTHPEILADKLHRVQFVLVPRAVLRDPNNEYNPRNIPGITATDWRQLRSNNGVIITPTPLSQRHILLSHK